MNSESLLLVQFSRAPTAGKVKTRMTPQLSAEDACELHRELTLWTCQRLLESGLGDVELSVAGDHDDPVFRQCRDLGVTRITSQLGADLGERMLHAIRTGLESYRGVILVGSDCPGIDAAYLRRAALGLEEAPLVFGPATDGGYVLVGARVAEEALFRDIPWGTDAVYASTVGILREKGLRWAELPGKTDIDRPEDLPLWEGFKRRAAAGA